MVVILTAALGLVWVRLSVLVQEGQKETARALAEAWLTGRIELGRSIHTFDQPQSFEPSGQPLTLVVIDRDELDVVAERDPFLAQAIERFQSRPDRHEMFGEIRDAQGRLYYRYARAVRKSDLARWQSPGTVPGPETTLADPLQFVLFLQLRADQAQRQLMLNRISIVAAGLTAGLLAIVVFWFITMRLILSPVRVLRDTAQKISEGDLNIRSDINTGDEFQELSETFNRMVENLRKTQEQLQAINKTLDLKLVELSRANLALHEANTLKNEFLANVSHELRTPLNAIIGFAEVLQETFQDGTSPLDEKRRRYVNNIITSSRRLLDLINDLLDLAKIEAGRMDVHIGPMNVSDTLEGLVSLMRPQAEKRQIQLNLQIEPNLPLVQTDAGKVQQILFNLLSNAIKFTPIGGRVTVRAALERLAGDVPSATATAGGLETSAASAEQPVDESRFRLRLSVSDTGPGIPPEMHEKIFEKFTQLDPAVTREHGGSGLGLAISRELARLLQGRIELDSTPGRGSTFSLVIPLKPQERLVPLMPGAGETSTASGSASL